MKLVQFYSDIKIQIITHIMIIIHVYAIISPMILGISHCRPSIIVIHIFLATIYFTTFVFLPVSRDPNLYESVQTCRTLLFYLH